jgi:hypothetical protein
VARRQNKESDPAYETFYRVMVWMGLGRNWRMKSKRQEVKVRLIHVLIDKRYR